jgi:hypothetical protein
MNHEPYGPPAAVARPSRVRTTALSTAVPIAVAIGAVFAAPIATGVHGGTPDRPHRSVNRADDCASRTAHTRLASEVASGAAGVAKWPDCAGD